MTRAERIAELHRQARLVMEEMKSVEGPTVRARIERGGQAVLAASPAGVGESSRFYTAEARLVTDGTVVTVYVPDNVVLPDGTVVDLVVGQHGYYLRSLVVGEQL